VRRKSKGILLVIVLAAAGLAVLSRPYWPVVSSHVAPAPWGQAVADVAASRPARAWATPVDAPPLANFYRVADGLYRGAQPDAAGMARLRQLGIKTVVNLRDSHKDNDQISSGGLKYVGIKVNTFTPKAEQLVEFLRVACDPNSAPVFVHCHRGIDRTGMMCAVYRIVVCGWDKEEAIDEMTNGPFGYDGLFSNVVDFLWRLDVDELKRQAQAGK
jgi:protein tyrosine phosphatase (PTP) superfamily phosphohydrolase (DUF442 family)